uniref:Sugar phosphate transporter domain-containing protein n=1 Tax=Chromera velia CCMP2878 TaxID=1169474 RepID=A0A0G4I4X7_9ALVE|mmetsp:Transcript_12017/g.23127  ORF Transcript_12017/g.23127 Transcript_12017/m.23127 type:complete len:397 (-) Transcript_12017:1709-2899(-)|eukprot:Cvel_10957.t1-p1 / transcript=Cvel_10957.t1 / gene=Cvel_10957 / organism=Chromera_velia_CCMP2878 / gene_product=Glucose-6-phosphate/phosphate translocator 1,, putative / transcript_product=Glucose-6-phosphate/phosphate translocator 1,, putative / location=Cvel_scaffold674:3343-4530(-) / protein_length=396 / sequence_SO=supercontig / SO=protein_coding / is_pseudo=false
MKLIGAALVSAVAVTSSSAQIVLDTPFLDATEGFLVAPPVSRSTNLRNKRSLLSFPAAEVPVAADQRAVTVRRAEAASSTKETSGLMDKLTLAGLIIGWYGLNVLYNIDNKKALNMLPLPYTISAVQMWVGIPIFLLAWALGINKVPSLKPGSGAEMEIAKSGAFHAGVHLSAVVALGAGAISFVHIVKAGEPVTTAIINYLVSGAAVPAPVAACLIPIIAGVGLASLKELSFTWLAFGGAMLSNICSSSRGAFAKQFQKEPSKFGENLDASNQFALLTAFSAVFLLPFCLVEKNVWTSVFNAALENGYTKQEILKHVIGSGVWYYLYNEVAFRSLKKLDPVSHAVANTVKRVALILVSVVVFGSQFTTLGAAGSAIAVAGTFLYAYAKGKYSEGH